MVKIATPRDLQLAFHSANWSRYEIVAPNVYLMDGASEMDICGIRPSGFVDEIEIKMTASDYKADFSKTAISQHTLAEDGRRRGRRSKQEPKHDLLEQGALLCNYFSFLLPAGLEEKCDIPDYAGLYICTTNRLGNQRVHMTKAPKRLHSRKASSAIKYKMARKLSFRYWDQLKRQTL